MNFSELGRVIEALGKDRGVQKDVVVKAIEQAFLVTARKKYGIQGEYETRYNPEEDDIEIFQYKNVVEAVKDPILEIDLKNAREMNEDSQIGDQLGIRIKIPILPELIFKLPVKSYFKKSGMRRERSYFLSSNIEKVNLLPALPEDMKEGLLW